MSKWHAHIAHTAMHMNMAGAPFGGGPLGRIVSDILSQCLLRPEVAISQRILLEAKALPMSLAKVPTHHRIAVGRNFEPWWLSERGSVLRPR